MISSCERKSLLVPAFLNLRSGPERMGNRHYDNFRVWVGI